MSIKVVCYGVRPNEITYFKNLNSYQYELNLVEALLTHENISTAAGMDAVILRGNCIADKINIKKFAEYGVKYLLTRTAGFNHIDLEAAADYDMLVARVPSYSPNAIAELSLTLAMSLLRHTTYTTNKTAKKDFRVDTTMFSKEIRNCTVGIIGVGKIGLTEASLFSSLGASVLGYDVYQSDAAKEVVEFKPLDDVLAESDIISIHVPYIPGENDQMVNAEFISKMKDNAILINTARGELQDNQAILDAVRSNKLDGIATDVFANESSIFFKKYDEDQSMEDPVIQSLVELYPKVLITPHVGSNTDEALKNMIETSYQNLDDLIQYGKSNNDVPLPEKSSVSI